MAETYSFRSAVNGFHRGDVITYLQKLMNENTALKERAAALEAENEALKKQLGDTENKGGGEAVDTALLGAAMYDARRFSDLLVGEANETAGAIFDKTAEFAGTAGGQTNELAASVSELAKKVQETLAGVESGMKALGAELDVFRESVTGDKAAFLKSFTENANEKFEQKKSAKNRK